jgi:hypothetical protein
LSDNELLRRWACQDSVPGNNQRRKKERKTEEEMERQKKRWEDNIKEWTGLKLSEAVKQGQGRMEMTGRQVICSAPTATAMGQIG